MTEKDYLLEYRIEPGVSGGVRIVFWMMFVFGIGTSIHALSSLINSEPSWSALTVGLCMTLLSTAALFSWNVSQFHLAKKQKRTANRLFGLYAGKWEPIGAFRDVTILKKNMASTIQSSGNVTSSTKIDVVYEDYILNENHRVKWLAAKTKNAQLAKTMRDDIASKLDLNPKKYDPLPMSPRARRR